MAGELRRVGVIELRLDDSKLRPAQVEMTRQANQAASSFDRLRGVLAVVGGVLGVQVAAGMIRTASATENASRAFASLTAYADGAGATLAALREATGGAVRDLDLLVAANNAMLLGLPRSAAAMGELAAAARILGRATGRTATEAFGDLAVGIGRQSRLILDNIGIVVDMDQAYKTWATSLGKTTQELTAQEQKAAFYAATMEQVRAKIAQLPAATDIAADQLARLGAQFDRVKTGLGSLLGQAVGLASPGSQGGESLLGELGGAAGGGFVGARIGGMFGPVGALIGAGVGALGGALLGSAAESRGVNITQNIQMDGAGKKELEVLNESMAEAQRKMRNLERR